MEFSGFYRGNAAGFPASSAVERYESACVEVGPPLSSSGSRWISGRRNRLPVNAAISRAISIAVSMSYSATSDLLQIGANAGVFLFMCAVTCLFFRLGERVENLMGISGLRVVTQLMGLVLAVIGVRMGIDGALGAVDVYLHPAAG